MKRYFPSVYTLISLLGFYLRMVVRIFMVKPVLILGTFCVLFCSWVRLHPGDWDTLVADNARRYQSAPAGMVLTEQCTDLLSQTDLPAPAGPAGKCTETIIPIAEEAGQIRGMMMWLFLKVILVFSVLMECIQILTGYRRLWPGYPVRKAGKGAVYHYKCALGWLPEQDVTPADTQS